MNRSSFSVYVLHFLFMLFSCCVMKLVHGFFCFSEESLEGEFFFPFLVQFVLRDSIFCLSPSLPSHLRDSAKLAEFCRVRPSFNRLIDRLVSSVDIDVVRAESVTNRPCRTGLGRFFEPRGLYTRMTCVGKFECKLYLNELINACKPFDLMVLYSAYELINARNPFDLMVLFCL